MTSRGRDLRVFVDLVVAPREAFEAIRSRAPWGAAFVMLTALHAILVLVQSRALEPALLADPLFADGPAAASRFWLARTVAAVGAPIGMALRAGALALLLQGIVAFAGGAARARSMWSLALHLELVFWTEAAVTTGLLVADPPPSLEALRATPLRAGLDLVWEPDAPVLRSLVAAANGFTLWWAALLGGGLALVSNRRLAIGIAAALWLGLVTLRWALQLV